MSTPRILIGMMLTPLPSITWREFGLWLLRRRRRVRITGPSMLPTLRPGDEVLVDLKAYHHRPITPGDIVVARHPFQANLRPIKRVNSVLPDGRCDLRGDNPLASTDSRTYGPLPPSHILGRVTCRFA